MSRGWDDIDLSGAPPEGPVAFGADVGPASLLAAYRAGAFPLPSQDPYSHALNEARYTEQVGTGRIRIIGTGTEDPYTVSWWSPDPRPVIPVAGVHVGRSLARQLRNRLQWATTLDKAFAEVVQACRSGRERQWLTDDLVAGLTQLHHQGTAHSLEVWEDTELIGGVFGVRIGSVFSLDSMFGRRPDASRVAVADLAQRFELAKGTLLDAQWDSPHIRTLGARLTPRTRYLHTLHRLPGPVLPIDTSRQPVHRLRPHADQS